MVSASALANEPSGPEPSTMVSHLASLTSTVSRVVVYRVAGALAERNPAIMARHWSNTLYRHGKLCHGPALKAKQPAAPAGHQDTCMHRHERHPRSNQQSTSSNWPRLTTMTTPTPDLLHKRGVYVHHYGHPRVALFDAIRIAPPRNKLRLKESRAFRQAFSPIKNFTPQACLLQDSFNCPMPNINWPSSWCPRCVESRKLDATQVRNIGPTIARPPWCSWWVVA
ncbi:hypothetical protein B0T22DRAFT_470628 [Podospora appendiculata]|uniref:Uncharacterized protein n=1 Tax=Podospora appendiculata TaxID=314037 RepID=A0AAE0X0D1_9PEZI|nr:hypothetical protein B0T22DRAFT_470628 [Podospora appendiculata]